MSGACGRRKKKGSPAEGGLNCVEEKMEKGCRKGKTTTSTMREKSDSTVPNEVRELEKAAVQCRNPEE